MSGALDGKVAIVTGAHPGSGARMMSVGLHCRLAGRPGRAVMLERFLDRVANQDEL